MSAYLPENVENLVRVGLETCEAEDRLFALGVANQEDARRQFQSQYGAEVAGIFLRQLGLGLKKGERKGQIMETWTRETLMDARIMQQVDRALGGQIATRSQFYRFVQYIPDDPTDVIVISGEGEFSRKPDTGYTEEEPFFVIQKHFTNESLRNFNAAMSGVLGMSGVRETLDDTRFDVAREQIRALEALDDI